MLRLCAFERMEKNGQIPEANLEALSRAVAHRIGLFVCPSDPGNGAMSVSGIPTEDKARALDPA